MPIDMHNIPDSYRIAAIPLLFYFAYALVCSTSRALFSDAFDARVAGLAAAAIFTAWRIMRTHHASPTVRRNNPTSRRAAFWFLVSLYGFAAVESCQLDPSAGGIFRGAISSNAANLITTIGILVAAVPSIYHMFFKSM
jgi:hypothetical protein